jgi:putative hemolysin
VPEPSALARIPTSGPLVVVANHPFGGIEGLILAAILERVRPDVRVMANYILGMCPELKESQIHVDPFGGGDAGRRNLKPMREAMQWVAAGGALGVFPSGEVSHLTFAKRRVTDPVWSETVARIVRRAKAPVLPMFFNGRNSSLFQGMGLVHPRFRTIMLPRELLKKRGTRIRTSIGSVIPFTQLSKLGGGEPMTAYLRMRTYLLRNGTSHAPEESESSPTVASAKSRHVVIAPESSADAIVAEVAALPADSLLLESGPMRVLHAAANEIPTCLDEIGRLREITFRRAGEGTGLPRDLDRFDQTYRHLFIWHATDRRIVGAYRLGESDKIIASEGFEGLYTHTLFKFKPKLFDQIGPALEMGRSFVCPEYQKTYAPLMLLWKGIGQFVVRHPRYRSLFGAVSISSDYAIATRNLLMAYLRTNDYAADIAKLVKPRNPPSRRGGADIDRHLLQTALRELRDMDALVSAIELDHKPMPVLLRQYLKLNGRLLGFNIDPAFCDVLDGLMLVDLHRIDRVVLYRYLGEENAKGYLAASARR